ncbi:SH3 domain-containing protein [Streptococcus hyovaginalis]|uniref:SH3 domain-containing protein n=1 Tax=Streptococcus hyovaginalis TaxID=149015 RepID=UPI003ADD987C
MTFKSKLTSASALTLILAGTALSAGASSAQAAVLGDNYPLQWKSGWGPDTWGMYKRQCTSFVAFRLSSANGFTLPGGYGNAITWGSVARSQGYRVDMNPAVGAVAWFGNGVNGSGSYGHVAWVAEVNGDMVTIEEYNFDSGQGPEKYWKRTFHKSKVSGYIHFKDLTTSATKSTTQTTVTASPVAISSSGTYQFTSRASIKGEPKFSSPELAYYDKGQSVFYDKILEADGYKWISYMSSSGLRRYIPITKLTNTVTATPVTTPQTNNSSLASSGNYQFTSRISIKNEPKISATEVAYYDKGQSVFYDKVLEADGYKWISYMSGSGVRRYIPISKLTNTTLTTSATTTSSKSTDIVVGDSVTLPGTFKVTSNVSGGFITSSDLAGKTPTSLHYIDPTPVVETDKSGKTYGDQVLYPGEYFSIPGKYKVTKVNTKNNTVSVKIGSRETWVATTKVVK